MSAHHNLHRQHQVSGIVTRVERQETDSSHFNQFIALHEKDCQFLKERIDELIISNRTEHQNFNKRFDKLEEKIDGQKVEMKVMLGLVIAFITLITVIQHLFL